MIDLIQTFKCLAMLVNTLAVSLFPLTVKNILFIMTFLSSGVTSLRCWCNHAIGWWVQSESSSLSFAYCKGSAVALWSQFLPRWCCFNDSNCVLKKKKKMISAQPLAQSSSMGYSAGALPSSYSHTKVVDGGAGNVSVKHITLVWLG